MQEDQRTRELEVLAESSRLLTATLDLREVLARLAGIARRRLEVDVVRIWLLEESGETLRLRAQQGVTKPEHPGLDRLPARESLSGWVITRGTPVVLADARDDPRLKNRKWFETEGLISFLSVPIMLDQTPFGILACMSRTRREFTDADVALAQALTAPAVAAVRNAALYAEALGRLEEIQAMQRVVSETLSAPTLETALRAVVREMRNLLRSDAAACSTIDSRTGRTLALTTSGTGSDGIPRYLPQSGQGLASLVVSEKRPMRSDDYLGDPRFVRTPAIEAWARAEGLVTMIAAPVRDSSDEVIALLWAFNRTPTPFTLRHEATLSSLAQQAALAIGRAHAFEEERRRADETTALLDIARACTSTLELTPLLKEVSRRTAAALGVERCAIFLWRGGHLVPVMAQFADGHEDRGMWERFKALRGQWVEEMPAHAEAIRRRRPVIVTRDSPLAPPDWFDSLGLGSALVVPLLSKDHVVGTLGLDACSDRAWQQSQLDLAMTIAAQVALAVDNARHYEDARLRAAEVETLARIGETLTSTLDTQEVLEGIADSAAALVQAQRVVVFELDPATGCLRARVVRGVDVEPGLTLHLGQGAAGSAALRLEPVWSDDVLEHALPGYGESYDQANVPLGALVRAYGGRAVLAVPVISREAALGAVCVCWDEVHRPDEREIRMLSALGREAAIAMENARLVGDLRQTLEELRTAQETLVQGATLRAVGELAAGAAHHLNNLMAVVLGRTQLLLLRKPDATTAASLRSIERAAFDAADTVRQIQGFAGTAKAGAATRFDLNAVIHEAIEFTRSRWEGEGAVRGTRIAIEVRPGPIPAVSGHVADIREVLINLILNAVDALPKGGLIAIATRAEPGRVIVSVSDSGPGMSPEVKRRAFEPFFTTKGLKRTGLGLAVAYGAVERHGGQITLESAPEGGTTVTFWLPAAEEAETADPAGGAQAPHVGSVLVIDDEIAVRELVADVLMSQGHRVTAAASGREGLARFEAERYDVVLTDLGMPDLDGWEVARAIKSSRADVPVLLLTGWADPTDDPSTAALVDGILKKPFGVNELAAAVAALTGR